MTASSNCPSSQAFAPRKPAPTAEPPKEAAKGGPAAGTPPPEGGAGAAGPEPKGSAAGAGAGGPEPKGSTAGAGALAWTTSWAAGGVGAGPALASGAAAVVLGFCGELLTDRLRIPPPLVAVCGIRPLLPGLAIYRGLFALVVAADVEHGLGALVGAAAIGLALAAGVTLGEYLGRPISARRDRYDERVRRRAMTAD